MHLLEQLCIVCSSAHTNSFHDGWTRAIILQDSSRRAILVQDQLLMASTMSRTRSTSSRRARSSYFFVIFAHAE